MSREAFKPQLEEPDSSKEETYTMTENPMFSDRNDTSDASSPHEADSAESPVAKVEKID